MQYDRCVLVLFSFFVERCENRVLLLRRRLASSRASLGSDVIRLPAMFRNQACASIELNCMWNSQVTMFDVSGLYLYTVADFFLRDPDAR